MNNIVLIGFMASGKSHLGALLAKKLKYKLIDLDNLIEHENGVKISHIFAKKGEDYFRKLEYDALLQLKGIEKTILITGGGTPTYFKSNQLLRQFGSIFFLDTSFLVIKERLLQLKNRPLGQLKNCDDILGLQKLYQFRRPIYKNLGIPIATDHKNNESILSDMINIIKAKESLNKIKSITVYHETSPYKIYMSDIGFTKDIRDRLGFRDYKTVIITSDNLNNILQEKIRTIVDDLNALVITIPDGEKHKSMDTIKHIHNELFKYKFNRQTLIIALGGGVVGDIAGFASAIYLRGIPIIHIPTTLLSMIDSSIGGKSGIDCEYGKNLIGAFHNPSAIICDHEFLNTLPRHEFSAGMAEVIKHAIIDDKTMFFNIMEQKLSLRETIKKAALIKANIVSLDPLEKGIRAHLNLGHTFAHAIEKVSDYAISHGHAVSIGLVLATKLSSHLKILKEDFLNNLKKLLNTYNLPTSLPKELSKKDILMAMSHDKKYDNKGLKVILPVKIGKVKVQYVKDDDILKCINEN